VPFRADFGALMVKSAQELDDFSFFCSIAAGVHIMHCCSSYMKFSGVVQLVALPDKLIFNNGKDILT
jgi:hypothetical protein